MTRRYGAIVALTMTIGLGALWVTLYREPLQLLPAEPLALTTSVTPASEVIVDEQTPRRRRTKDTSVLTPRNLPTDSRWLQQQEEQADFRRLHGYLGGDEVGRFLLAAFLATGSYAGVTPNPAFGKRVLEYVKTHITETEALVEFGLARLPTQSSFSLERAGLLDLVRVAEIPYRRAREIYLSEVTEFPAPVRQSPEVAKNENELNRALSSNHDTLRVLLAVDNLLKAVPAEDLAADDIAEVLSTQQDDQLRRDIIKAFKRSYPHLLVDLRQRSMAVGVPEVLFQ